MAAGLATLYRAINRSKWTLKKRSTTNVENDPCHSPVTNEPAMHPADQAMSLGFAKAQEVVNELAQTFQTFKSNYYPVLLTHPPDSRDSRIQELHALQKRLLQYVESANVLLQSARELKDQISYHHDTCVSARSYISALPVEVMRDILRFAILGHYNPLRSAAAFSTVCRRWRDIVLSEKDMWSSLTIHDVGRVSSNAIGRFATRSHPHPFHLKLDETWIPIFSLKTAFETPFVDNLRSVTWNLSDNFYKFLEALNEDDGSCHVLPNVQIVSIQGAHDCPTCWRRMGYDYLLENRAEWALELYFPALTSLSLDRVTCVLEVPVISRLEHLSLLSVPFEEDTCDVIFRHGSKLKTLEISWLSNLDMDIRGATPSSAARWPLQHLQQLKLGQVPVHLASFFMASIDTPELEKLTLYANLVTRAEHRELAITNLASALRHTVSSSPSLHTIHIDGCPDVLVPCCAVLRLHALQVQNFRVRSPQISQFSQFSLPPPPLPLIPHLLQLFRKRLYLWENDPARYPLLERLEVSACMVAELTNADPAIAGIVFPISLYSARCAYCPHKTP